MAEICVPVKMADVSLISSRSHSERPDTVSDFACLENTSQRQSAAVRIRYWKLVLDSIVDTRKHRLQPHFSMKNSFHFTNFALPGRTTYPWIMPSKFIDQ